MNYDAIILGFGKAGKTLAAAFAKQGKTVALVEKSAEMYGGTCINVGCIPSKSLVTSAAEARLHSGDPFERKAERYAAAIQEKRRVTALLRRKNYEKLTNLPGVSIYDGLGSFLSDRSVEVSLTSGGKAVLESSRVFVNTGSETVLPPIEVIDNHHVYTSRTRMDEEKLPRRLTLIGAGYIGMEFASMYSLFGAEVTVVQDGTAFLPKEDRDVALEIRSILEKQGVRFILGAKPVRLEGASLVYERDGVSAVLPGDAVLLATGRKAATEGLNVEKAGIALTNRGAIPVNELLQTAVPGIWALGDVNGGPQFTFVSLDDSRIILSQLGGGHFTLKDRVNLPYSVFMNTPLSRVGLTEEQAAAQGLPFRVFKIPTAAVPKAQVLRHTEGFLKALVHAESGRIIGAALLCPESYEIINLLKLAMDFDLDYRELRDRIYTHPTMTEALNDLFAL